MNSILLLALLFSTVVSQDTSRLRKLSFTNLCKEQIWVGSWGMNPNGTQNHPLNGGWAMGAGETKVVMVSGLLSSARFWPRTGCKTKAGGPATLTNPLRCDTGDCWNPNNNGLECAGITGQPPATLFEATLTGLGAAKDDTYDVSVVDGYNVGIGVQSVGGTPLGGQWGVGGKYNCGGAKCSFPVAQKCPKELQLLSSDGNSIAGCSSICTAVKSNKNDPTLNAIRNGFDNKTGYPLTNLVCCDCAAGPGVGCNSPKCQYGCSPHDTSNPGGKCNADDWPVSSNGIPYQDLYKDECPDSYAWQFADLTSTFHCINADYNIQFCPENDLSAGVTLQTKETTQIKIVSSTISNEQPISVNTESLESVIEQPIDQLQQQQSIAENGTLQGTVIGATVGGVALILVVVGVVVVAFVFKRRRAIRDLSENNQPDI